MNKVLLQASCEDCKLFVPSSKPLKNLQEVSLWKPEVVNDNKTSPRLNPNGRVKDGDNKIKLIVCHMMGGYLMEDKYTQMVPCSEVYNIVSSWSYIEYFIYFSHNFVTIPPTSWIDIAHRNHVPILGTVITEWKEGYYICEDLFKLEKTALSFADQLVWFPIATHYCFDGWLINIENPVEEANIPNLFMFLEYLKLKLEASLPASKVIWYDSLTRNGHLCWQNELNLSNLEFAQHCDAIFLNYFWDTSCLFRTHSLLKSHPVDVYVGIDVFGRGSPGGGGLNTHKAVELISQYENLHIALFAPGWIYESKNNKLDLLGNQLFWDSFTPFCQAFDSVQLPFDSFFNVGFGKRYFVKGKLVSEKEWSHISLTSPLLPSILAKSTSKNLKFSFDEAYEGGSSLELEASAASSYFTLLEHCHFATQAGLLIRLVFKPANLSPSPFSIRLSFLNRHPIEFSYRDCQSKDLTILAEERKDSDGWNLLTLNLKPLQEDFLKKIEVKLEKDSRVFFGRLTVMENKPIKDAVFLSSLQLKNFCHHQEDSSICGLLQWDASKTCSQFNVYGKMTDIYGKQTVLYITTTRQPTYTFCRLKVPPGIGSVTFEIQTLFPLATQCRSEVPDELSVFCSQKLCVVP
ncbi:cytosolic endo-beta-N-acetylglucosaminidase-like [Zophobas morio]|uniref:cytosolic endo-beta-N-acetylglucosaminidase-like n=1 Tax=Zophobas morio TaxID=2755281 RepID=UPI003082C6E8